MKQKVIFALITFIWPIIIDFSLCPDGDFYCTDPLTLFFTGIIFFSGGCIIGLIGLFSKENKWLAFWRTAVVTSVLLSTMGSLANYYTI